MNDLEFKKRVWIKGWRPGCDADALQRHVEQCLNDFKERNQPKQTAKRPRKTADDVFSQLTPGDAKNAEKLLTIWKAHPTVKKSRTRKHEVASVLMELKPDLNTWAHIFDAVNQHMSELGDDHREQRGLQYWLKDRQWEDYERGSTEKKQHDSTVDKLRSQLNGLIFAHQNNPTPETEQQIQQKRDEIREAMK